MLFIFLSAFLLGLSVSAATPNIDIARTRLKAKQALSFCRQKGYNSRYCILIDMGLPSGVKRFMVWDFHKNGILVSGLVSHGCGNGPWSGVWSKDKPTSVTLIEATVRHLASTRWMAGLTVCGGFMLNII